MKEKTKKIPMILPGMRENGRIGVKICLSKRTCRYCAKDSINELKNEFGTAMIKKSDYESISPELSFRASTYFSMRK